MHLTNTSLQYNEIKKGKMKIRITNRNRNISIATYCLLYQTTSDRISSKITEIKSKSSSKEVVEHFVHRLLEEVQT